MDTNLDHFTPLALHVRGNYFMDGHIEKNWTRLQNGVFRTSEGGGGGRWRETSKDKAWAEN